MMMTMKRMGMIKDFIVTVNKSVGEIWLLVMTQIVAMSGSTGVCYLLPSPSHETGPSFILLLLSSPRILAISDTNANYLS